MRPSATDEQLLAATQESPDAFALFYRRHARQVLAYLRRRTASADVALDLTAETFAAALEGAGRFRPRGDGEGAAAAWLFGIARNKLAEATRRGMVVDRTRRRLEMQPVVLDDEGIRALDEDADEAQRALEALPPDQGAAVRARLLDEREYDDIAAELRCSPSVVRQRVSRGVRAMRLHLEEKTDET